MDRRKFQFIYGIIIVIVGILVIYRIPQMMVRVEDIEYFANSSGLVRLSFFLLGGLLILAGGQKIYKNYK